MSHLMLPVSLRKVATSTESCTITLNFNGCCSYALMLPSKNAPGFLRNNGAGILTWDANTGSLFVAPIDVTAVAGSMASAITITQPTSAAGAASVSFKRIGSSAASWAVGLNAATGSFDICSGSFVGTNSRLHIDAQGTHIADKLFIGDYVMPSTKGAAGQVLQTDGAGAASWEDLRKISIVVDGADRTSSLALQQHSTGVAAATFGSYQVGFDGADKKFKIAAGTNGFRTNVMMTCTRDETRIMNTLKLGNLAMPTTSGSVGQYLRTNGAGEANWADITMRDPVFVYANTSNTYGPLYVVQRGAGAASTVFDTPTGAATIGVHQGAFKISTSNRLGVNDRLAITAKGTAVDRLTVGAYTLPQNDGIVGQMLQTDGAGNVTWASPLSTSQLVLKGGQAGGPLTIGTTDANPESTVGIVVNNAATVHIGAAGTTFLSTTPSTSSASGAVVVAGGLGVGGAIHAESVTSARVVVKRITSEVSPYTVLPNDTIVFVCTMDGDADIILPEVAAASAGRKLTFANMSSDTSVVNICPAIGNSVGTGMVNVPYILAAWTCVTLVSVDQLTSDGGGWIRLAIA